MTEKVKTVKVELFKREIEMRMPTQDQLMMWNRTIRKGERALEESGDATAALNYLGKIRDIVDSLIVSEDDVDWLDELMVAGKLSVEDASKLVVQASEKLAGGKKAPAKKVKAALVAE